MTRTRTNIESEPTRKNVMEADATISKHAYEMQLRSESRYAIGSLHEQEDAQSVVSNQFSEFLQNKEFSISQISMPFFVNSSRRNPNNSRRGLMQFGRNSVQRIGPQKLKSTNLGMKSKIGIEPSHVRMKLATTKSR